MYAVRSSEISLNFYETIRRHIPLGNHFILFHNLLFSLLTFVSKVHLLFERGYVMLCKQPHGAEVIYKHV